MRQTNHATQNRVEKGENAAAVRAIFA